MESRDDMMTDTEPSFESVPVVAEPPSRLSKPIKVLVIVGILTVFTLVGASLYQVPYFSQSPGAATALETSIEVEGADFFPSEGEVLFTTVRVAGELSLLEWIGAHLDGAVEVRHRDDVLGTQTRSEQIAANLALMSESQELAKRVALGYLGYEVVVENGALVQFVVEDSGAFGFIEPGDVVVEAGGVQILTARDLVDQIDGRTPGDSLDLSIRRLDETGEFQDLDVTVVLGTDEEGEVLLGVALATSFELTELPVDIEIDTARVGGPSAGLALSLSILDVLTDGELTGGIEVATTGTIDVLGNVGPIGGVEQKAHAVRRAGIDLFLVPEADFEAAVSAAGDDLEVVAVATFAEAVEVLAERGGNGLELAGSVVGG